MNKRLKEPSNAGLNYFENINFEGVNQKLYNLFGFSQFFPYICSPIFKTIELWQI